MIARTISAIVILAFAMPAARSQPVCFSDAGIRAGTVMRIYDSSIYLPPVELRRIGGGKTQCEIEVRTETWDEVDPVRVRDMKVVWSRFQHENGKFVPGSFQVSPQLGRCYRIKRQPGIDTIFAYCDGSSIVRPREHLLQNGFGRVRYPELILYACEGLCLTEEHRDEIVKRISSVFSEDSLLEYSDVTVSWKEPGQDAQVPIKLRYTESLGPKTPGSVAGISIIYVVDMLVEVGSAHLIELRATKTIIPRANSGNISSQPTSQGEEHLIIEWLDREPTPTDDL